jgi:hypothetical protein
MFAVPRAPFFPLIAALLVTAGFSDAAQAGWLTIRNDTNRVVIVQETVVQDGQVKRLKPVRLLPGESVRQMESMTGTKTYEVFDAQNPTVPLCTGKVRITDGAQTVTVTADAKGYTIREVPVVASAGKKW